MVVNDENDLMIYGLDITLTGDLLHNYEGVQPARNIS